MERDRSAAACAGGPAKPGVPLAPVKRLTPHIPSAIQMADKRDNPYKREYHPYKRKDKRTARQKAKAGIVGGGVAEPGYKPTKDSLGNKIWDGDRGSLKFSDALKAEMAKSKGGGCEITDAGCTGGADAIDHIEAFSDVQSGFDRYVICDGRYHWTAVYKDDADAGYNNDDDASGFQWSCTSCNSKKSGKKGIDKNPPKWLGACPGACGYVAKDEPAGD